MPRGLKYADAVKLLGGSTPAGRALDNLLSGALSVATAGGSEAALNFFDAKTEMVRLGHLLTDKISDSVRGLSRYDRSERLRAAHSIIVVTAFFEGLDLVVAAAELGSPELTRAEQVLLAADLRVSGTWLEGLIGAGAPAPSAEHSAAQLERRLSALYTKMAGRLIPFLHGLAIWDEADDRTRRAADDLMHDRLPALALEKYAEAQRRLAVDVPEFELWLRRTESIAIGRSLETLESTMLLVSSGRSPERQRAALALAYRAELSKPSLGGASGDIAMPTLGEAYVDPLFRVKAAGADARPADESWWDVAPRSDLSMFLAAYLTLPEAVGAPLVLLGQPGAGKSALTRVLAARLPAADFLAVRVVLREVPAEAEIQDQIEHGLRSTIGETVAWADLARSADGALPVILLDGFDELLQATGIHQSDYLQRVAAFQQREAVQGRPVAVLVTSRIAVADRARVPADSLVVRLDAFDEARVARWLEAWNAGKDEVLPLAAVWRFPDLAAQPLLLLMLALYDATGRALRDDLDTAELYERLLTAFADREVRRQHPGRPEADIAALIQGELVRLSIVAFAMFNRLRQWVTGAELDSDLAGLGLEPAREPRTEGFRSPLTPGQEVVGRFFFIQRAQAVQDGHALQTYEFLHATFGEYLVARLIVQTLRASAAAAGAARAMPLQVGKPDDTMLRSLLGLATVTARGTVLSFVTTLLAASDRAAVRQWLVEVLRTAMTRPEIPPTTYRAVEKRADFWMATYSLNLVLLALACGEPLRASEIFRYAGDPSAWLRGAAQQWRAAVPAGIWLDVTATMSVARIWTAGRRDLELSAPAKESVEPVDLLWSLAQAERLTEGSRVTGYSPLGPALTSMHLSNILAEDAFRHALEPLLSRMPETLMAFVIQESGEAESIAHILQELWLTSALGADPVSLRDAYTRAATTLGRYYSQGNHWGYPAGRIFVESLSRDTSRLPPDEVAAWLHTIISTALLDLPLLVSAVDCYAAIGGGRSRPGFERAVDFLTAAGPEELDALPPIARLRGYLALAESGEPGAAGKMIHPAVDFLDRPEIRAALAADRTLRLRLENLPDPGIPLSDQAG